MRFADKGYYIEEYIKCANCGVLIYGDDIQVTETAKNLTGRPRLYCSDWCRQWAMLRESGDRTKTLPLPRD